MKKVFALIIAMFIFVSFAIPTFAAPKDNLQVVVSPAILNTIPDYAFLMQFEGKEIKANEQITLMFPAGTHFVPPLPREREARQKAIEDLFFNITFNGQAIKVNKPVIDENNKQFGFLMIFSLPIPVENKLEIKISKLCKLATPAQMEGQMNYRYSFRAKNISGNMDVQFQKLTKIILIVDKKIAIVNGQRVEMPIAPYIKNGHTMVGIRFLAKAFDAEIEYNSKSKAVYFNFGFRKVVIMWVGKTQYTINDNKYELPVAPEIKQGSMCVPVSFLKDIGAKIDFNLQRKEITITYIHVPQGPGGPGGK